MSSVFDDAIGWWHPGAYSGSGAVPDLSGNGNDLTVNGSTLHLAHWGDDYLRLPDVLNTSIRRGPGLNGGNVWKTPRETTDTFEMECRVAFGSVTGTMNRNFLLQGLFYTNYGLRLSNGKLQMRGVDSAVATITFTADDTLTTLGIEAEQPVSYRAVVYAAQTTTWSCDFYYRLFDSEPWTKIGATKTASAAVGYANQLNDDPILGSWDFDTTRMGREVEFYYAMIRVDGFETYRYDGWDSKPALVCTGTDGDVATIPLSLTTGTGFAIDAQVLVTLEDWTPGRALIGQWHLANTDNSWVVYINATGYLNISTSNDGLGGTAHASTNTISGGATAGSGGLIYGGRWWVRVVADNDANTVDMYLRHENDPVWRVVDEGLTLNEDILNDSSLPLSIGGENDDRTLPDGSFVHAAIVKTRDTATSNWVTKVDVDFRDASPGDTSFTARTGGTVTIAANATVEPLHKHHIPTNDHAFLQSDTGDVANQGASIPDADELDLISGVLDVIVDVSLDHQAGWECIAGKGGYDANGWTLWVTATNDVFLRANNNDFVTAALTHPENVRHQIRCTYDTRTGVVDYYDRLPGEDWTRIGGETDAANAGDLTASTDAFTMFRDGNNLNSVKGAMYRCMVRYSGTTSAGATNGFATVVDVDYRTMPPVGSFTEGAGRTVTIDSGASIEGGNSGTTPFYDEATGNTRDLMWVDRPMLVFDGAGDYLSLADDPDFDVNATDQLSAIVAYRTHKDVASARVVLGKTLDVNANGWNLFINTNNSANAIIEDAATNSALDVIAAPTDAAFLSTPRTMGLKLDNDTGGGIELIDNGTLSGSPTSLASVGDASNTDAFTIGANSAGGEAFAGEVLGAAVWTRELTDAELVEAHDQLTGADHTTHTKLEVAFDDDPLATAPTWTDISEKLRSWSMQRGRRDEFSTPSAATLVANLGNETAEWASWVSPYQPRPMRPVRLAVDYGGCRYWQFYGFVESWPVTFPAQNDSVVQLQAVDGFKMLAYHETAVTQTSAATGTRIGDYLDEASWPAGWRDLDAGQTTAPTHSPNCEAVLELCQETARSESGLFFIDRRGYATFHDKTHRTTNTHTLTVTDAHYQNVRMSYDDSQIWNEVTMTAVDGSSLSVQDATSITEYGKRTLKAFDLHAEDSAALTTQANYVLAQRKDPKLRVDQLTLTPWSDPAFLFPRMLSLEPSRPVMVRRDWPNDLLPLVQAVYVEGIRMGQAPGNTWTVVLELSPYI